MRHPRKGRRPSRGAAGQRRVAAGVNARPTGGREVSGRGREGAAAGGAASAEGRAAEPGSCRAAQGCGGRERPPYKRAGGKRPGPGGTRRQGVRCPQKGGQSNREVAGRRGVAAGVNARPTGGREVSAKAGRERRQGVRRPQKGGRPSRGAAGQRRVAAGVNARPTGGREVSGRDRGSAGCAGRVAAGCG